MYFTFLMPYLTYLKTLYTNRHSAWYTKEFCRRFQKKRRSQSLHGKGQERASLCDKRCVWEF